MLCRGLSFLTSSAVFLSSVSVAVIMGDMVSFISAFQIKIRTLAFAPAGTGMEVYSLGSRSSYLSNAVGVSSFAQLSSYVVQAGFFGAGDGPALGFALPLDEFAGSDDLDESQPQAARIRNNIPLRANVDIAGSRE